MIKVDTVCMEAQVHEMQRIADELNNIISRVDNVNRNLRWNTNISSQVRTRLANHNRGIANLDEKAALLKNALSNAVNQYIEAEKKAGNVSQNAEGSSSKDNHSSEENDSKNIWEKVREFIFGEKDKDDEITDRITELIKSIAQWFDKTDSSDEGGIISGGLAYWKSLVDFFTGDMKGLTGAEDWCNLADNSAGVFEDFYKYLKKYYDGVGEIFSSSAKEIIDGVGIGGSSLGLLGAVFGATESISNGDKGIAGQIGEGIGVTNEVTDLVEKILEAKEIGTAADGEIYSPLKFYTTIVKGYISAIEQGFESFEEYIADGSWDLGDTAATGVDSSVTGLYAMVSALTFGIISEGTTGVSAEEISNKLKKMTEDIGRSIGNCIKNK